MKVLLSIKPEYAERILNGSKRFEFRRALFQRPAVESVVIYATMPVGKVVGEFEIDGVVDLEPASLWAETEAGAGITREFFDEYFRGRERGFAIRVKNPKRYDQPRDLKEHTGLSTAPQSFCYVG